MAKKKMVKRRKRLVNKETSAAAFAKLYACFDHSDFVVPVLALLRRYGNKRYLPDLVAKAESLARVKKGLSKLKTK